MDKHREAADLMHHFCTYFDRNYLLRGLTLYRSLSASGCEFTLHVLALDKTAASILKQLDLHNMRIIPLPAIEAWEPRLNDARGNRSLIEYYFTLSPILPLYILETETQVDRITYLDADLYFYQSPEVIFTEMGDHSILITEHRYPDYLKNKETYGLYNVQFESFRRDATGMACLQRWRDQCLDWCYDQPEETRYADQKYLDEWPALYGNQLTVLQHKGAGVAPWNWARHPMKLSNNQITIDGEALIFYHFHGLKIFHTSFISNGMADWGVMPHRYLRWFYAGYLRQLRSTHRWLQEQGISDIPIKDRPIRGPGVNLSTMKEIARKAWTQGMLVF